MEKLRKLTQMAEHPEQFSDKEWQEVFKGETVSQEQIEQAWQHFNKEHLHRKSRPFLKIAASFIGFLLLSSIAIAAIIQTRQKESPTTEVTMKTTKDEGKAITVPTGSVMEPHTVVFENAELQQIMDSLSMYYNMKHGFRRDSARQLRLYYEWDQHNNIEEITELLNNFEQVNISLKGDSIIIE